MRKPWGSETIFQKEIDKFKKLYYTINMKKLVVALFLSMVMAFGVAACGIMPSEANNMGVGGLTVNFEDDTVAKGDKGDPGEDGAKGENGDKGDPGEDGAKGENCDKSDS
jgi:hypothetical protein